VAVIGKLGGSALAARWAGMKWRMRQRWAR